MDFWKSNDMLPTRNSLSFKNIYIKWRDGKNIQGNGKQKNGGRAILIIHKIDFKLNMAKIDKEGHYIMVKVSIHQGDFKIVIIYAPNIIAPKYIKQIQKTKRGNKQ